MRSSTQFYRCVTLAILAGCLHLPGALHATTVITVTNVNDSGPGSLRDAISSAATSAPQVSIHFAITPTNGTVQTITPVTSLPAIAAPVVIDGYTQPGAHSNTLSSGNNAVILIELNGAQAPGDGLVITGGTTIVRGLIINRFSGSGINCSGLGSDFIQGNFIGTDATGTNAVVGNGTGITIGTGATFTIIGGTGPAFRNVISGNPVAGIDVQEQNVLIQGNFIGTDASGTNALAPNSGNGVILFSQDILGGTNAGSRNIVSGNGGFGVAMAGVSNIVEGNFIGTDVTGSNAVSNLQGGVNVAGPFNSIGGRATGAGNVISGNGADGVDILTNSTTVQGNFIGTDRSGAYVIANGLDGVLVNGSANTIGGTNNGTANVISGNANGIRVDARDLIANFNLIQGNRIGTDVSGTQILSNSLSGVLITVAAGIGAARNTVSGNIITGSGSNGVTIVGSGSTGNSILGNSISSNALLGIDLGADGVTPDHLGFLAGPNNFQNSPALTSAACSNGSARVLGSIDNLTPFTDVTVEFFANPVCNISGFGEGETFLLSTNLISDINSNVTIDITFSGTDLGGQFITATATDFGHNTSEFSVCVPVADMEPPVVSQTVSSIVASANANCQAPVPNFVSQVHATDNCADPSALTITQLPTSGTLMGLGVTNVTLTVSDAAGNSTNWSTVTFSVIDTNPPTIAVTSIVVTGALGSVSNKVDYATPVVTDNCTTGTITVTCFPPSGSVYVYPAKSLSISTQVVCTASDDAGNIATNSFSLKINRPLGPNLNGFWLATTAFSLNRHNYIFGAFQVVNRGTLPAPKSLLKIFLSTNQTTNNAVLLKRKFTVQPLRALQTSPPFVIGVKLPNGVSGVNQFLIAAVDANGAIPELNELDNNVVSFALTNFVPHKAALANFFQTVHQAAKGH